MGGGQSNPYGGSVGGKPTTNHSDMFRGLEHVKGAVGKTARTPNTSTGNGNRFPSGIRI